MTSSPAPQGHNRPPLGKEDYIAAIELWAQTRRVADALSVDELDGLDPGVKLVARDRFELEAIRHFLLKHPKESAALGVLKAISFLSDERGYCDLSQPRLADFFGRGRQHINECVKALKNDGLIKEDGESVKGKPARLYPVVPRIFASESINRVWFFDAFAPYEPAKPGRKPKIPVVDTATPISETPVVAMTTPIKIPVVDTATPISKYLSSKSEIPVVTAATQDSFETPVEVEEEHIPRVNGCASAILQEKVASASQVVPAEKERGFQGERVSKVAQLAFDGVQVSSLESRLWNVFWRWGYYPEETPKRQPASSTVPTALNFAKSYANGRSARNSALALESVVLDMEAAVQTDPSERSKPGLGVGFFKTAIARKIDDFEKNEFAVQKERERIEKLNEIAFNDAHAANGKKLAALDQRISLGNQAAAKRIEAGANGKVNGYANGHANGHAHPASQNSRTITDENGVRRYNPEFKAMPPQAKSKRRVSCRASNLQQGIAA